ncbi:GNAT family N-acetyltransferase [Acidisoma cellulosilytica]|uniref:GNAT family N-acetyltransferase n=1 Tax=Acidisoma cellulosilyticum TaxID=2802395 RepID=A0A964E6S3_9PROT|nr:GNAT family N-acetyltransferase [Acidisoma cellulosilyticum]MCB8883876.1 GNAT family N-acetyltransferase [Acidisoma cellulosilyticum]
MSIVRPARVTDAAGIAAVHVAAWRSAYPGMLPDRTLTHLNPDQQELYYSRLIRTAHIVHVAVPDADDPPRPAVIGFVTAGPLAHPTIAEGEIETLYVLDDFREQGVGRALMRAAAVDLAAQGCGSLFVWVLSQNPSRWFYERMGGVRAMEGQVRVGGENQPQTAFVWDPIERLLAV